MRILDANGEHEFDYMLIMLTPKEAKELVSKLRQLDPSNGEHLHVNDESYVRELTIAIYTSDNLHFFSPRIQKLLKIDDANLSIDNHSGKPMQ